MFGAGTYLSSDFSTSLIYSESGCGWGGSLIGSGLSCTALCEIVEHPDVICEKQGITDLFTYLTSLIIQPFCFLFFLHFLNIYKL